MTRILAAAAVMLAMGSPSQAEDAKPFYLNRDGTVEQRLDTVATEVEKLRGDVDMLRTEIARLKGQDSVSAKPTAAGLVPSQVTYQMCINGTCKTFVADDISKVPIGAKVLSARAVTAERAASPCECGPDCQCAAVSAAASPAAERTGIWFPGKRIIGRLCNR